MQIHLTSISFNAAQVNGFKIFYREAGDPQAPAVLLLHGFPTSSHMFRNLIPQLSGDYYVGHFALETHAAEIGLEIHSFLAAHL